MTTWSWLILPLLLAAKFNLFFGDIKRSYSCQHFHSLVEGLTIGRFHVAIDICHGFRYKEGTIMLLCARSCCWLCRRIKSALGRRQSVHFGLHFFLWRWSFSLESFLDSCIERARRVVLLHIQSMSWVTSIFFVALSILSTCRVDQTGQSLTKQANPRPNRLILDQTG